MLGEWTLNCGWSKGGDVVITWLITSPRFSGPSEAPVLGSLYGFIINIWTLGFTTSDFPVLTLGMIICQNLTYSFLNWLRWVTFLRGVCRWEGKKQDDWVDRKVKLNCNYVLVMMSTVQVWRSPHVWISSPIWNIMTEAALLPSREAAASKSFSNYPYGDQVILSTFSFTSYKRCLFCLLPMRG
jgi:hypothetical protein